METALHRYEQLLTPARQRFEDSPAIRVIASTSDARFLESFLIHFCAIGSRMTEPVEGWIQRAAGRCAELGLASLAEALFKHAKAESGHHLMMLADLRILAARWNVHREPFIDVGRLLNQAPSPGALRYCTLHEENIAGRTPYAQLAIEYEIEMLPLRYGKRFVEHCLDILGLDAVSCLSFITEHINLDIGHTKLNARELTNLIELHPEMLPVLASAGTSALDAYSDFLGDCARLADRHPGWLTGSQKIDGLFQWRLHTPIIGASNGNEEPLIPTWLEDARSLRASVLCDNGRRPQFRMEDGCFSDPDPIDLHAYHILAYDGLSLVGCVRVYRLSGNGPPCLTEALLGEDAFAKLLNGLHSVRRDTVEIGRWIVHPTYRKDRTISLAVKLAAGSGALARFLAAEFKTHNGLAICAVGTADKQDMMLTRLGLIVNQDVQPIDAVAYSDSVRVCVCLEPHTLSRAFQRLMDVMADEIGIVPSESWKGTT